MEDGTRTKMELIKPMFFKAGIPIAISVAGFILARFTIGRKYSDFKDASTEYHVNSINFNEFCSDEDSFQSLDMSSEHISTNTHDMNSLGSFQTPSRHELEEEIVHLESRIQELQGKELELEFRFLRYQDLKDEEVKLMEIGNTLLLEMAKAEFLDRELSTMEAENKRFHAMVLDFVKAVEQLHFSRLENGVLHRGMRRLLRKVKERSHVIGKLNLQIEVGEAEILQNHEELERRAERINVLENKILEMKMIAEKLQKEKNELIGKLECAENSASLKNEEKGMAQENYNRLVIELEQLQRDRAAEVREVIYLRWCNACLRHELMRRNQEQEDKVEGTKSQQQQQLESDFEGNQEVGSDDGDSTGCTTPAHGHGHSKRPKLFEKFKKWVEGNEKTKRRSNEREKTEGKCFGKHVVSDGAEDDKHGQVTATSSCSRAEQN